MNTWNFRTVVVEDACPARIREIVEVSESLSWRNRYEHLRRKHALACKIAAVLWVILFLVIAWAIGHGGRLW